MCRISTVCSCSSRSHQKMISFVSSLSSWLSFEERMRRREQNRTELNTITRGRERRREGVEKNGHTETRRRSLFSRLDTGSRFIK